MLLLPVTLPQNSHQGSTHLCCTHWHKQWPHCCHLDWWHQCCSNSLQQSQNKKNDTSLFIHLQSYSACSTTTQSHSHKKCSTGHTNNKIIIKTTDENSKHFCGIKTTSSHSLTTQVKLGRVIMYVNLSKLLWYVHWQTYMYSNTKQPSWAIFILLPWIILQTVFTIKPTEF